MQEIFTFESHGAGKDGKIIGEFKPTGIRPQILDRMFGHAGGVKDWPGPAGPALKGRSRRPPSAAWYIE